MKISNLNQIKKIDPEDIHNASGDREREIKRKSLINRFIWWSSGEQKRFSTQNNEERIIIKRQFAYGRLLTIFGSFTNFAVYNCFFTGIYNFRSTEVLDMRRVPFAAKFTISSLIAYQMCYKLWDNQIYEAELYQIALKYRSYYDKQYKDYMPKEPLEPEIADLQKSAEIEVGKGKETTLQMS